jgi:hypothetical protein
MTIKTLTLGIRQTDAGPHESYLSATGPTCECGTGMRFEPPDGPLGRCCRCEGNDMLAFRVFGPWMLPNVFGERCVTVSARTPQEAIHAVRHDYEPAHSITCTDRNNTRSPKGRWRFDVDGREVTVEEL